MKETATLTIYQQLRIFIVVIDKYLAFVFSNAFLNSGNNDLRVKITDTDLFPIVKSISKPFPNRGIFEDITLLID